MILAITSGDTAGIGTEVVLKAVRDLKDSDYSPIIITRADAIRKYYPEYLKEFDIINNNDLSGLPSKGRYLLDIPSSNPVPVQGTGSTVSGAESKIYIDKAVELWKNGIADGIVTGPVSKGFIEKSGCRFSGHTEYIADLINETTPYMMMFSPYYRVILATTHIPISSIPAELTAEKLYNTIKAGHKAVTMIDGGNIKIAVTGLDPHSGDDGAIGHFDMDVTAKVVEKARKEGMNVEGPYAADTLFSPERWKSFNLIVVHYHDQGLIPFKMLAFETGVNVTLGLSIIRTSPDHGTAYNIAGKNIANHSSMIEAIKLAERLCREKK
jgi:4-hydroxythreonine-4-phosphate dehydrogenase